MIYRIYTQYADTFWEGGQYEGNTPEEAIEARIDYVRDMYNRRETWLAVEKDGNGAYLFKIEPPSKPIIARIEL
jgi:hypothetical protein